MSGLLSQYLGYGADEDKPDAPDVVEGVLALYWAEDITTLYRWNWNGDPDPVWEAVAQPGVTEAPTDGTQYVRQGAAWAAVDIPEGVTQADVNTWVAALCQEGDGIEIVYDPEAGTLTFSNTLTEYTDADADARIAAASIADLSDVDDTAPEDGQVLKWSAADSKYVPSAESGGESVAPTIVQYATGISNSGAVTLPAAPTPGNLLLAIGTHWSNQAMLGPFIPTIQINGGSHEGVFIGVHIIDSDDTAGPWQPYNTSGGGNTLLMEIADWDGQIYMNANYFKEQTAATHSLVTGVPKDNSLVVGFFCSYSSNVAPTGITGADTLTQGVGTATNISPREITPFTAESDKGSVTVVATYADSRERSGIIITLLPA